MTNESKNEPLFGRHEPDEPEGGNAPLFGRSEPAEAEAERRNAPLFGRHEPVETEVRNAPLFERDESVETEVRNAPLFERIKKSGSAPANDKHQPSTKKPLKDSEKPKGEKRRDRPGLGARVVATSIVATRAIGAEVARRREQAQPPPEPPAQEPPDVRASREASEARIGKHLAQKYGGTPFSDAGALAEIVKERSVIASLPPSQWETEASRRLAARLTRLQRVKAAQREYERVHRELDDLSRNPISSKEWPRRQNREQAPARGFWANAWRITRSVGGVMARPITSRLQIAVTERRLSREDIGRVDDYIGIHRDGISVWNPSEHRGEKRIPWRDLGHYEIEFSGTHWVDNVNTALSEMGQPRTYPGGIGYVKITDPRQRGEIEVIAYMANPDAFVREIRRIQAMVNSLAMPMPEEVAIPTMRDFIPVPYQERPEGDVPEDHVAEQAWRMYQSRYPHARRTRHTQNDAMQEYGRFQRGLPERTGPTTQPQSNDDNVVEGEFTEE